MTPPSFPPVREQLDRLLSGLVDVTTPEELERKLERSRRQSQPLVVKVGFDPTAPDIHLGHTVLMRKMREFQDLGHRVVYVIGDFTASIGDPSGRSKTRPPLSRDQILAHAETYTRQAFLILDEAKTETRFNSEWLGPLGASGLIRLAGQYTVARMLERRDFRERFEAGAPISIHELLYPLAQAYDSVALAADVELGGTDQLFNLNVGRDVMPGYDLEAQVILTTPLLEGIDGAEKMSKSLGNYVGVTESPEQIFGKTMSISDSLMIRWFELLIEDGPQKARELAEALKSGARHPRDAKVELARSFVERFHGREAADAAERQFEQVFTRKQLPDDIPEIVLSTVGKPLLLPNLIAECGLAKSASDARRLIRQGGVKVDGERAASHDETIARSGELLLQVGKRRFARVRFEKSEASG